MKDTISYYFKDIQSFPLLTVEQESELGRRIRNGDEKAREQMIKSNLRLVVKVARVYENMGLPIIDLISEGNIGLMIAVDRFNPDKFDNKFSSYACWLIKNKIRMALLKKSRTVRLPSHIGSKMSQIYKAKGLLEEKLQREPFIEEIAKEVGITEATVRALFDFNSTSSLEVLEEETGYEPQTEDAGNVYDGIQFTETIEKIRENLSELTEKQRTILTMRFGLDGGEAKTLDQIGQVFGVSRERIRQIQDGIFKS